ncbi:MAG: hypothetical protein ACAH11_11925 [Sphingomonas sp.]
MNFLAPTFATIAALDPSVVAGRGAPTPFVEYEAENGVTDGFLLGPDRTFGSVAAEASGRRAVRLAGGTRVAFTLDRPADALTVRYAIPDGATGSLGIYVDDRRVATLSLTSRHSWFYGKYPFTNDPADGDAHHFFDHARIRLPAIPAGATVTLRPDAGLEWAVIDLADFEQVDPPRAQPEGSISLLDFGPDPTGSRESGAGFRRAIAAAHAAGRALWIPPGIFHIRGHIAVDHVTIEGAGMWHSELRGEGLGFYGDNAQAVVLRDFAVIGDVTERKDHLQLSGIGGAMGGGSVIERLWLQHHKVGLWFDGPMDGIRVSGLRIFDMTADGLNFHRGVSNAAIEDSFVRGTGDDGLASWSGGQANRGIAFRRNTVIAPVLANGIAVYGGSDIRIEGNLVADTVTQGGGIHLGNRFKAVPFSGRISIADNLLVRAGSFDPNWKYGVGALWFYALDAPIKADIRVTGLEIIDSSEEAVMFTGSSVSGVTMDGVRIVNPGSHVVALRSAGSASFANLRVEWLKAPTILACNPGFRLTSDLKTRKAC